MKIRIESKTMKDSLDKAIHELEKKGLIGEFKTPESSQLKSNSDYTETTNYIIADVEDTGNKEFNSILKKNHCDFEEIITVKNKD